jgi:hypothetical protein
MSYYGSFGPWALRLMPYMENQALFDKATMYTNGIASLSGQTLWSHATNLTVTNTPIAVLQCPSDKPQVVNGFGNGHDITFFSYGANLGNTNAAQSAESSRTDAVFPSGTTTLSFLGAPFDRVNGNRVYNFGSIQDGTTNTLLVGELIQGKRGVDPTATGGAATAAAFRNDLRGLGWYNYGAIVTTALGPNSQAPDRLFNANQCNATAYNPPCDGTSTSITVVSGVTDTNFPAFPDTNDVVMASRSMHRVGVHACMVDGSVRMVSNGIDVYDIWQRVGASQDGTPVDDY